MKNTLLLKQKMQTTNKLVVPKIKLISFKEFSLWDVKRYLAKKIESKYPIVKLAMYITEENHKVQLSNFPEKEFGILGVSNRIGIFDSYKEKGANINQPYKQMQLHWLAYNPYRINVGSIGMMTDKNHHQYISPAYVVFSCKEKLLADFLFRLFRTEKFTKIVKESTIGSVRQNLTFNVLKTLEIPLPTIEEQKALLEKFYRKIELSVKQQESADSLVKGINNYLLEELGVSIQKPIREKGLTVSKFSLITRWAVDYVYNLSSIKNIAGSKFRVLRVRDFMIMSQYGLSSKASEEKIGTPMLRMNNIVDSKIETDDLKYINITEDQKEKMLLNKGDLLFNRTNSKELVGKTAIFELDNEYTFASYLIRLKLDTSKVNIYFINYLMNSTIGRAQIDMISRQVSGQANINAQELQDFIFPIPDISTQNEIVNEISKMRNQIDSLNLKAEKNHDDALNEFEQGVFKI